MVELWPFIQLLLKKWQLVGRTFTSGRFFFNLTFDGLLLPMTSFEWEFSDEQ